MYSSILCLMFLSLTEYLKRAQLSFRSLYFLLSTEPISGHVNLTVAYYLFPHTSCHALSNTRHARAHSKCLKCISAWRAAGFRKQLQCACILSLLWGSTHWLKLLHSRSSIMQDCNQLSADWIIASRLSSLHHLLWLSTQILGTSSPGRWCPLIDFRVPKAFAATNISTKIYGVHKHHIQSTKAFNLSTTIYIPQNSAVRWGYVGPQYSRALTSAISASVWGQGRSWGSWAPRAANKDSNW